MSGPTANQILPPALHRSLFRKHLLRDRIAVLEHEGNALRDLVQEHAHTVLAREQTIADCEAVVRAREHTIEGYERTIRHCETVIETLETAVRDRDQATASLDAACKTVLAREETIKECEAVVRAREQTIAEYEQTIRNRESAIAGLEAAIQERDQAITALNASGKVVASGEHAVPLDIAPKNARTASHFSTAEAGRWLNIWKAIAAKYSGTALSGGQSLIDPYLLERVIHDRIGHLLIATVEGRAWYDNDNTIELPQLLRLGMIRKGDTVFDCGANQGVNSLFYAHAVGSAGRVFSFDPFPLNIDIGHFNASMNGADNIEFIRAGLSDQAARVVVSVAQQSVGLPDETAADSLPISLVPLDAFAALRPSFVKIDIEGAEVNALEGAHEILALEPTLYIEVHPNFLPRFDRSPADIFKHVSLDRYTCYINYPGVPPLTEYTGEFEMTEGCALFCVPKSRPVLTRHFGPTPTG
jgi:FkbM family methyltransferase